ncbi:hypothetical protein EDB19DRAFT_1924058 [Suillus lakei]|nr:hypothetical protein EDB19DRAFT_1924058 [Suillus lakei]
MLTASFRPPSGGWYSRPPPPMQRRGRSRQISPVALARQASEERRVLLYLEKQQEAEIAIHTNFFVPPQTPLLLQSEKADPLSTHPQEQRCSSDASSLGLLNHQHPLLFPLTLMTQPPSPPRSLEDQVQVAYALDDIRLAKILLLKLKGIDVTSDNDPRIDEVQDEDFDMCFVPSGPLKLEEPERLVVQETRRRQQQKWEESQRRQRLRMCEQRWEEEKQRLRTERLRAIRRREEIAIEEERRRLAEIQKREEAELALRQRSTRVGFSMAQRHTVSYGKLSQARLDRCSSKRDEDPFQYNFMRPMKLSTTPPKRGLTSPKPLCGQQRTVSFKGAERAEEARRIAGISTVASPSRHRRHNSAQSDLLLSLLQERGRKAKGKDVERPAQLLEQSPLCSTPTPILSIPSSDSIIPMSSSVATSRSNSWLSFDITSPEASSPVTDSPKCSTQRDFSPRSSFAQRHVREVQSSRPAVDVPTLTGEVRGLENMGKTLVRHVIDVAKGLQSAYITTTMFTSRAGPSNRKSFCRYGYRARPADVKKFTSPTTPSPTSSPEPIHFIPLVSPFPAAPGATLVLHRSASSHSLVTPSPLRPRTPPTALAYRMRPVANPEILRLRALQNLMCARGKEWEGRGREGGLGCGKERMLGIAFEGRGPSGLGCEIRFVIAG